MINATVFIRRCPICGKAFYCDNLDLWIYKRKNKAGRNVVFCSWGCLRKHEKSRKPKEVEEDS